MADEEGQLTLRVPRWGGDDKIPFIGIGDDYGDIVHGVLLSPEEYNGQLVQGVSVAATAHELTAEFEKGRPPSITCPVMHRCPILGLVFRQAC